MTPARAAVRTIGSRTGAGNDTPKRPARAGLYRSLLDVPPEQFDMLIRDAEERAIARMLGEVCE